MRNLPPLTELRAFEAAARHMSFKLAAAELGVTPTAISHQIKLLEQHCGQPLFRRRPRPLALTFAGKALFPVLRDGFEAFGEALSTVRAGAASGRLRVTATNAFAARWLVPRLPRWREAHPRLKLDIVGTDAVLDLRAGEADVAIYAVERPTDGPCVELLRDTFHVVASPRLVVLPCFAKMLARVLVHIHLPPNLARTFCLLPVLAALNATNTKTLLAEHR